MVKIWGSPLIYIFLNHKLFSIKKMKNFKVHSNMIYLQIMSWNDFVREKLCFE
jgi:hypothetical protein